MTGQVIPRDKLGALTKIGQGGQGVVYGAPNVKTKFAASMIYKEYKPQTLAEIDFTALAAMPALVEDSLTYAEGERLISTAAWPCALVENTGATTGFVMPAIPEEFFIPLTTVKGISKATAEFQHLLNYPSVLAARGIDLTDAQRYGLLREVASAFAFLHKHGVCVGDISPKNLLFSLTPHEAVYLIDCDSARINGVSALHQVETPGWQAPAGEELATIYTDTYKLGLLALRLLTGDQDTTNPQHLAPTTPTLVRQIITDTLSHPPEHRPLPEAWDHVLGDAVEQAEYRQQTTAINTAPADLDAPAIPIVHSRPSTPTSRPTPPTPPPPTPPLAPSGPTSAAAAPSPQGRSNRTTIALVVGAIAFIAGIAAAVGIPALVKHQPSRSSPSPQSAPTSSQPSYGAQVVLPLTALNNGFGVAVDADGNVYLADIDASTNDQSRILKLAAGSNIPTVLPFSGVAPTSIAVDALGRVYITDVNSKQVLTLAPGSNSQVALPFTGLNDPFGVAVDAAGAVYVTDRLANRVLNLAAGTTTPAELPFTGLNGPEGVAVDARGNLYVADNGNNRVLKLAAGANTPAELPFTGLRDPTCVAVDGAGNVYVASSGSGPVLKLPAQ